MREEKASTPPNRFNRCWISYWTCGKKRFERIELIARTRSASELSLGRLKEDLRPNRVHLQQQVHRREDQDGRQLAQRVLRRGDRDELQCPRRSPSPRRSGQQLQRVHQDLLHHRTSLIDATRLLPRRCVGVI